MAARWAQPGQPVQPADGDPAAAAPALRGRVAVDDARRGAGKCRRADAGASAQLQRQDPLRVDQFVLRGGKAIVFVDPYSELAARGGGKDGPAATSRACSRRGVKLLPDTVAADRRNAQRVMAPGKSGVQEAVDYIAWINLHGDEINRNDPITANLRQMSLASSGIIEALPGATTNFEPLLTTSPQSMKLPASKVAGLPDVAGLLTASNRRDAPVLAARITGPVETAFPDARRPNRKSLPNPRRLRRVRRPRAPAASQSGERQEDVLKKSVAPAVIVVVADTDLLDERFWAQSGQFFGQQIVVPTANNADFVANSVEVLAGGEDLVGLRSRGTSVRPFTLVQDIQRTADDRYAAEQRALQQKLQQTQAKLQDMTRGAQGGEASATLTRSRPRRWTSSVPTWSRRGVSCAASRRHCVRISSGSN